MLIEGWVNRPTPLDGFEPGQEWVRREQSGDLWDRVRVLGFSRAEEGIWEAVVAPISEFASPLAVDTAAFTAAYEAVSDA